MTDKTTIKDELLTAKNVVVDKAKETQMSGLSLYSRFAFAGAVCCSVTHGALTPVDV